MPSLDLSIIIPIFNESSTLPALISRIYIVLNDLPYNYEVIFIDDKSNDRTVSYLDNLTQKYPQVKFILLQKHIGQQAALLTGLKEATGNIIITLDGDLQYLPEEIPHFINEFNKGYDLVLGYRDKRNDPLWRIFCSVILNTLIRKSTRVNIYDWFCPYNALKKTLCDKIVAQYKKKTYLAKLLAIRLSNRYTQISISHYPRKSGSSRYNFFNLFILGFKIFCNTLKVRYNNGKD